jgi:hypothetical protein
VSDREYDLAELLRSPLEPDPADQRALPWRAWLIALAAGIGAGSLAVSAATRPVAGETLVTVTTAAAPVEVVVIEPGPFPNGYVAIANDVAVRAEAPIVDDDRMLVPMTMVVRRGVDPADVERPLGGRWEMRTSRGVVESQRLVFDAFRPGVLSVEFQMADERPEEMVMVERWDGARATGSVELPWPGVPFSAENPIEIDVGVGAGLRLEQVELGNLIGQVEWELTGAELGIARLEIDLFDEAGELVGSYESGLPALDPEPGAGFDDFVWGPGFRVDQDRSATVRFTAHVVLGTPAPTDVAIPVPG